MLNVKKLAVATIVPLLAAAPAVPADGDGSGIGGLSRLFAGIPHRVVVADPVVFVALDTGLATYDVSDPGNPAFLAHLYLDSPARDVAVAGNLAYVASEELGLMVIDVSDPADPVVAGTLRTAGARAVAVDGTLVCLAETSASSTGLRTIDVSNPASPLPLGFLSLPAPPLDVTMASRIALVGTGTGPGGGAAGLYAIDVSDPASPVLGPGSFLATGKPVHEIAVTAGTAYLATGFNSSGSLVVADLTSPTMPVLRASVPIPDAARGVSVVSGIAYVAARSLGLLAYDVSNPSAPVRLDGTPTRRETVAVAARGDVAFLAERSSIEQAAFTAIDTVDPANLREIASRPYAEATAVALTPGLAFLLRRDALHLFDASTPGALNWLSSWSPPRGDFSSLAVDGNLVAVGQGREVFLVDVTSPATPQTRSSLQVSLGVAVRLALASNTLYVVTGAGLETFDVSSPGAPTPLGTFATPGWSSALALAGTIGYLTAGDTVHVLDLAVPALPAEIASITIAGEQMYGAALRAGLLAVTGLVNRLYAIDVADAARPMLESLLPGGPGFDVVFSFNTAVVAVAEDGLVAIDVADPASPAEVGFYDLPGTTASVAADGELLYAATVAAQHWVMSCTACSASCIEQWPVVAANSLLATRWPTSDTFSWQIAAGSGEFNLHRTMVKGDLPGLAADAATVVGVSAPTAWTDSFSPPTGAPAFYRVFGRGTCTGLSHP